MAIALDAYVEGVLDGKRAVIARAITLVESAHTGSEPWSSGRARRIGISWVPGVGKSTRAGDRPQLIGLLSNVERTNCWQPAEQAGHVPPGCSGYCAVPAGSPTLSVTFAASLVRAYGTPARRSWSVDGSHGASAVSCCVRSSCAGYRWWRAGQVCYRIRCRVRRCT